MLASRVIAAARRFGASGLHEDTVPLGGDHLVHPEATGAASPAADGVVSSSSQPVHPGLADGLLGQLGRPSGRFKAALSTQCRHAAESSDLLSLLIAHESDRIVAWHNPCGHQERGIPGQEEVSLEDACRRCAAEARMGGAVDTGDLHGDIGGEGAASGAGASDGSAFASLGRLLRDGEWAVLARCAGRHSQSVLAAVCGRFPGVTPLRRHAVDHLVDVSLGSGSGNLVGLPAMRDHRAAAMLMLHPALALRARG